MCVFPHRLKACTRGKLAHLNSCDHNNCPQTRYDPKWRQRPSGWWGVSTPGRNKLTSDMFPCCRCHHTVPHNAKAKAWPTHSQGDCSSGYRACCTMTKRFTVQILLRPSLSLCPCPRTQRHCLVRMWASVGWWSEGPLVQIGCHPSVRWLNM